MSEKLTDEYKLKILCAVQILKVDNPKITGDEIAHEINNQGYRRAKDKLWNKGTIGHLIAEGESKSDMINPVKVEPEIIPSPKFELSPEMTVGKRILFFDTETTGLNIDARIVQIAWLITDLDGTPISESDYYIKPDNFIIPDGVIKFHGITNEKAIKYGRPVKEILELFIKDVGSCDYIAGHNINFDIKRVDYELLLLENRQDIFKGKDIFCTMLLATKYCKLPSKHENKFKWPNLEELHNKLFDTGFANAHNALADIKATAKCFFELKKLKVIKIQDEPFPEIPEPEKEIITSFTRAEVHQKIKEFNDKWAPLKEEKKGLVKMIESLTAFDRKMLMYESNEDCKDFSAGWLANELFNINPKNFAEICKTIEGLITE